MAQHPIPQVMVDWRSRATAKQTSLGRRLAGASAEAKYARHMGATNGYNGARNALIVSCLKAGIPHDVVAVIAVLSEAKVRDVEREVGRVPVAVA
jgi:hypothetical protein